MDLHVYAIISVCPRLSFASARGRVLFRTFRAWPAATAGRRSGALYAALLWGVVLPLIGGPRDARAQGYGSREYDIKAAYLYNFAKYTDWPAAGGSDITIGVLGQDPFGADIDVLNGKKVAGKTLVIRRLGEHGDPNGVNILFISHSEKNRIKQILDSIKNPAILTVGETPGFARSGGIINLVMEGGKVRFEINVGAVKRSTLQIDPHVLDLGKKIRE